MELTIVLPTKNSEKYISYFLESLKNQDYNNYIVYLADGGSIDKTLSIINNFKLNYKLISKKDRSAEEGINKCLNQINTKYFCILNSDDYIGEKNYLSGLIGTLKETNSDVVLPNFGSLISENKKKILDQNSSFEGMLYNNIVPDIGWVAKTDVLKEGLYSTDYKVGTSYHFLLRLYKKKYKFFRDKNFNYYFRMGGQSYKYGYLGYKECKDIAISFGANKFKVYKSFFINASKFIIKYKLFKFLFGVKR